MHTSSSITLDDAFLMLYLGLLSLLLFVIPLQSVSSVELIISSELFHQFLKSGVKGLKEANVVNPTKNKKQNRRRFLSRAKSDDSEKAEVSSSVREQFFLKDAVVKNCTNSLYKHVLQRSGMER